MTPRLDPFKVQLKEWLMEDAKLARARRRTGHRLFEGLQTIGYSGAYDSVQRFVRRWKSSNQGPRLTESSMCGPNYIVGTQDSYLKVLNVHMGFMTRSVR